MEVVIDKLESHYALVELPDRTYALIPRKLLDDPREGDSVEIIVKHNEFDTNNRNRKSNRPQIILGRG